MPFQCTRVNTRGAICDPSTTRKKHIIYTRKLVVSHLTTNPGPEVIFFFMLNSIEREFFFLLINVKMPTIVDIILGLSEFEKS